MRLKYAAVFVLGMLGTWAFQYVDPFTREGPRRGELCIIQLRGDPLGM